MTIADLAQLKRERHDVELHQVLAVQVPTDGAADFPLRPSWVPA